MNNVNTPYGVYRELIFNPATYEITRMKRYSIWMCIPDTRTIVRNKLVMSEDKTTPVRCAVLSGVQGEQWVDSVREIAKRYTFSNGMPITEATLLPMFKNGCLDWIKITPKADNEPMCACFVPAQYQFEIKTFHGVIMQGNAHGVEHGKGDFVVCPCIDGTPAFWDQWIVNGTVFVNTYDNRGFTDVLDLRYKHKGVPPKPREIAY